MDHRDNSSWKPVFGQQAIEDYRDAMASTGMTGAYDGERDNAVPRSVDSLPARETKTDRASSPTVHDFEPFHGSQVTHHPVATTADAAQHRLNVVQETHNQVHGNAMQQLIKRVPHAWADYALRRRREFPDPNHAGGKRRRLHDAQSSNAYNNRDVGVKREGDTTDETRYRALDRIVANRDLGEKTTWRVRNDKEPTLKFAKELEDMGRREGARFFEFDLRMIPHDEATGGQAQRADGTYGTMTGQLGHHIYCAHCRISTHTLADCPKPHPREDYMPGCPNCNTMNHRFDDYDQTKAYPDLGTRDVECLKFSLRVLIERRHNKPGILSGTVCWMEVLRKLYDTQTTRPLASQGYYPWTVEYSRKFAQAKPDERILKGKMHWVEWVLGVHTDDDPPLDPMWRAQDGKPEYYHKLINSNRKLRRQVLRDDYRRCGGRPWV